MKSLKQFVEDFLAVSQINATPANTIGMGNPIMSQPSSGELCSEPLCGSPKACKKIKKMKIKSLSQFIKESDKNFIDKCLGLGKYDNYSEADKELQIKQNEAEKLAKEMTFEQFKQIPISSSIFIHNLTYEKIEDDKWKVGNSGSTCNDKSCFDELKEDTKRMFPSILFFIKKKN